MLKKLFVNNYKSLQNFEFNLENQSSVALLGKNGSGKSSVGEILYILQQIGNGETDIDKLIYTKDFSFDNKEKPISIQVEVNYENLNFEYKLVVKHVANSGNIEIKEECLKCESNKIFSRKLENFTYYNNNLNTKATSDKIFSLDNSFITLPLLHKKDKKDPINLFKAWLKKIVLFAPLPQLIDGISHGKNTPPNLHATNLGDWTENILNCHPEAYNAMADFLQIFMHDFKKFHLNIISKNVKEIITTFGEGKSAFEISFNKLSDGEKCFFIGAVLLAANKYNEGVFCFWDEPDSYLGVAEIEHFIITLRKGFKQFGQIILTSHNDEVLHRFPDESIYIVRRENHLSPTKTIQVSQSAYAGDKLLIQRQLGEI